MRKKIGREQVISSIYFHFVYDIRMRCISHLYHHPEGNKAESRKMMRKIP